MVLINKHEMRYGEEDGIIYLDAISNDCALAIINRKSHPCVYVTFPGIEHISSYDQASEMWDVHGGFTFLGNLTYNDLEGLWLGWDYAHYGDYLHSNNDRLNAESFYDKKWTLDELIRDGLLCLKSIFEHKLFMEGE